MLLAQSAIRHQRAAQCCAARLVASSGRGEGVRVLGALGMAAPLSYAARAAHASMCRTGLRRPMQC